METWNNVRVQTHEGWVMYGCGGSPWNRKQGHQYEWWKSLGASLPCHLPIIQPKPAWSCIKAKNMDADNIKGPGQRSRTEKQSQG